MLSAPISLLALLLYSYASPIFAAQQPHCYELPAAHSRPLKADCLAALQQVPDGTIEFDGQHPEAGQPMNFLLPAKAREKIQFPAAFRYRSCEIHVTRPAREHMFSLPPQPSGPPLAPGQRRPTIAKPASAMYYTIWRNLREGARSIIRDCVPATTEGKNIGGSMQVDSTVEGHSFYAFVKVQGRVDDMSKSGVFRAPMLRHATPAFRGL
ncbi:hypothetical protein MMC30_001901 [Trapelia coarctata]|nr:hypothetical protein [Trapelia coarctata]